MTTLWVVLIVAALAFACFAVIGVRPPDDGKLPAPGPAQADAARAVAADRVGVRRVGAVVQRSWGSAAAGAGRGRNGPCSGRPTRSTLRTRRPPRRPTQSRH